MSIDPKHIAFLRDLEKLLREHDVAHLGSEDQPCVLKLDSFREGVEFVYDTYEGMGVRPETAVFETLPEEGEGES